MRIFTDNATGLAVNAISITADNRDVSGNLFSVMAGRRAFDVMFQQGSPADGNCNGLTNEAAIAILLHRLQVLQGKAPCAENLRAIGHLQLANAALMERAQRMQARQALTEMVPGEAPARNEEFEKFTQDLLQQMNFSVYGTPPEYRRVTPHECPQCHALWLFWPKERSGRDQDMLNLRSAGSCPYCEAAGVGDLIDLNAPDGGISQRQSKTTLLSPGESW